METLVLTSTNAEGEEVEEEIEIESTSSVERIQCAYFAISSVESMDLGMMPKDEAKRIKGIIKKSVDIIEDAINEMHSELFEPE